MKIKRAYWILGIWVLIIGYFIVSLTLVGDEKNAVCKDVEVIIESDEEKSFVTQKEIFNLLKKEQINLMGTEMAAINIAELESVVAIHPTIAKVDAYKTFGGKVRIEVEQRKPVLRIINNQNVSVYLDQHGKMMPVSRNYTAHVLVVTGYVKIPKTISNQMEHSQQIADLFELASYILDDELLKAQIEHIYVESNGELKMIPRVGSQVIYFGDYSEYDRKFNMLKALYEQGFKKYGWTKYKAINLKYKNQVVCTKI